MYKMIFMLAMLPGLCFARITEKTVEKHCSHYKFDDCALVKAIITNESSYNEFAYNNEVSGSYGLMQIQCDLAKGLKLRFGCKQLFGAQVNIRFGILYLKSIEKNLPSPLDVRELLSIYNGGYSRHEYQGFKKAKRCHKIQTFKYAGFPTTKCYPGEYINEFYVWKVFRTYKAIKRAETKRLQGEQIVLP